VSGVVERRSLTETGARLVEELIPDEGLSLDIREEIHTVSTGFRILKTEPSSSFSAFLGKNYPKVSDAFSGEIVLKSCGKTEHSFFHNDGPIGEMTLAMETDVDLRQSSVGMPSSFGVAYMSASRGPRRQAVLTSSRVRGSEPCVVMPQFPVGSSLSEMYTSFTPSSTAEQEIARTLLKRLFSMKRPVSQDVAETYGSVPATLGLIRDERMQRFEFEDPLFSEQARVVNRALERALLGQEMGVFLADEIRAGRVGEQHGDARAFDNLHFVRRKDGGIEAFIRDPVRLSRKTSGGPKLMREWFVTHDDLQAGMLIGGPFVQERFHGFVRNLITAYMDSDPQNRAILTNPLRSQLFGLGIAYGVSIDLAVANYHRRDLEHRLDTLRHSDSGRGTEEIDAQFNERVRLMDRYWDSLAFLAETDFVGWKEAL